jgi:hypothetical protein
MPPCATRTSSIPATIAAFVWFAYTPALVHTASAQAPPPIDKAVIGETNQRTSEISTEELRRVLADPDAVVLDTRPAAEFSVSHIPGARNVAPKPGVAPSMYVSDVASRRSAEL